MASHALAAKLADNALSAVRRSARDLSEGFDACDRFLDVIGNARFALLGEASHGTHEFYAMRAEITKRLIVDHGFRAIAVEADWPDAYRINRYVRATSDDHDADAALSGFKRFPTWMWRNTVILDFIDWLRGYNETLPRERRVGFYGIDLYSLSASMQAVLRYLDDVDPDAAKLARRRYSCFDHFAEDTQAYGYATAFGMSKGCEEEVVHQLTELSRRAGEYTSRGRDSEADEFFYAEQNARLVKNAEAYYRTMFRGRVSSWNLRDQHMVETLEALDRSLATRGAPPRIAVWAHNSHLGDASATEMRRAGEWNVGQLMRRAYGQQAVLVGFTTYAGTVTAASEWDGPAENKRVRPALPGSYETLFHEAGIARFLLMLRGDAQVGEALEEERLERAIGVIYLPESERTSHYFHARLPRQFDAVIHLDQTRSLTPLDGEPSGVSEEAPETFPSGV